MTKASPRIILVTGASRGIGRAAALQLAREGNLVIATARSKAALEKLDDEIRAAGSEAVLVPTLALAYGVPASSALALSVAIQVIALGTTLALGALAFAWLGPVLAGRRTLSESVDLVADAPLVTVSVGTTTGQ